MPCHGLHPQMWDVVGGARAGGVGGAQEVGTDLQILTKLLQTGIVLLQSFLLFLSRLQPQDMASVWSKGRGKETAERERGPGTALDEDLACRARTSTAPRRGARRARVSTATCATFSQELIVSHAPRNSVRKAGPAILSRNPGRYPSIGRGRQGLESLGARVLPELLPLPTHKPALTAIFTEFSGTVLLSAHAFLWHCPSRPSAGLELGQVQREGSGGGSGTRRTFAEVPAKSEQLTNGDQHTNRRKAKPGTRQSTASDWRMPLRWGRGGGAGAVQACKGSVCPAMRGGTGVWRARPTKVHASGHDQHHQSGGSMRGCFLGGVFAQRAHSARTAPIITVIIQVTTLKTTHLRNHAQSIQNSKIQTSDACHGSQGPKFCPL